LKVTILVFYHVVGGHNCTATA